MSSIKVAVRCRPLFDQEKPATGLDIQGRRILLDSKTYDPDYTFPPTSTQDDVFSACQPILQCVKDGLNGTIMVYGQTGTGKTYTMLGNDGDDNGLVHKVIAHMLEHVQQKTMDGSQCALTLSIVEMYNERLTDMLSPNGDAEVTLISGFPRCTNKITLARLSDANSAVKAGLAWRHTASTLMNERSSRSHVVFIIDVEEHNEYTEQTDVAHLFLVDLAGSESLKKSQASGSTANEAGKINRSLLALKSVFLALSNTSEATRPQHVPYRDSKLTELLQDSVGGTARTLMVACISAVGRDIEETKSTLLYAVKARSIRNAANTEKEKLLIRLRSIEVENQRLRNRLQERVNERGGYYVTKEEHERYQQLEEEAKGLAEDVRQLIQDRDTTAARKHISESQTKVLQGIVADKEEELQRFKQLYQEALRRFEGQASALQRVVHMSVEEARRAVQAHSQGSYHQLDEWRVRVLRILEEPPRDAPVAQRSEEEEEEHRHQQSSSESVTSAPSTIIAVPLPPNPFQQQQQPHRHSPVRGVTAQRGSIPASQRSSATRSLQGTPVRGAAGSVRGGRAAGRRAPLLPVAGDVSSAAPIARVLDLAGDGSPLFASAPDIPIAPPAAAVPAIVTSAPPSSDAHVTLLLEEADDACRRVVARMNGAFTELATGFVYAHARYAEAAAMLQTQRRERLEAACAEMRGAMEESIRKLQLAEASAARDMAAAAAEYSGHVAVRGATPAPADPAPLLNAVRNACISTVRGLAPALPSDEVPVSVHTALDNVVAAYRTRCTAVSLQGLLPLAVMSSPQISASSSPKASPTTAELMPPLVPAAPALLGVRTTSAISMEEADTSSPVGTLAKENVGYMASTTSRQAGSVGAREGARARGSLRPSNRSSNVLPGSPGGQSRAATKRTRSMLSSASDSARVPSTRPERSRR